MPALARFTSEIPFQPLREGLLPSDDFHESSDSWVPWGRERQLRCPFKLAPSQPLLSGMGAVYLRDAGKAFASLHWAFARRLRIEMTRGLWAKK